jgi:tRNA nucleotidyltransferase (CCA-adding enzyme)
MQQSSSHPTEGNKEISYGVIPCRQQQDRWEFLLIKNFRGEWGFPKGHPEQGETAHAAATRELLEETTLEVEEWLPMPPFTMKYDFGGAAHLVHKEVQLFPALVRGNAKPGSTEIEWVRWVTIEEGEELATFGETKQVFLSLQPLFRSS